MEFNLCPAAFKEYEIDPIEKEIRRLEDEDKNLWIKWNRKKVNELKTKKAELETEYDIYCKEFDIRCEQEVRKFKNNTVIMDIIKGIVAGRYTYFSVYYWGVRDFVTDNFRKIVFKEIGYKDFSVI